MVKIFDYKEWPKSFTEKKKWGLEDVKIWQLIIMNIILIQKKKR